MYIRVDVDADEVLNEIDTEDLIAELESRGREPSGVCTSAGVELLEKIYLNRRLGKDYQAELDKLIYTVLGKIV